MGEIAHGPVRRTARGCSFVCRNTDCSRTGCNQQARPALGRPHARVETPGRIKAAPPAGRIPPGVFPLSPRASVYNPCMNDLKRDPCESWSEGEETPDGLRGTPAERFAEAARRVFSASKDAVDEADARERAKPHDPAQPRRPGRPRTSKA